MSIKSIVGFLLVVSTLLVACSGGRQLALPQPGRDMGIAVGAPFAAFYSEYGGSHIFGYPVAGAFTNRENGRLTQYFENLVLELTESGQIAIVPLGRWALGSVRNPQPVPISSSGQSQYFPSTNQFVQDAFLTFYHNHHGSLILGDPISPQLEEGGLQVQYFENGRLEWQPAAPVEGRVQLGRLGQAHYFSSGAVYAYKQQMLERPADPATVQVATVQATARLPILYAGDEQTIYVEVTTPDGRPVPGVTVYLTLVDNGAQLAPVLLGTTDQYGIAQGTVLLTGRGPGEQIEILTTVESASGEVIGQGRTWFRTWW